jgi:outer membrane protein OmpA-like peptidoglycan-associated protein
MAVKMREFWQTDAVKTWGGGVNAVGVDEPTDIQGIQQQPRAADTQAQAAEEGDDPADLEAEIKQHLAAIAGPYKEAVANNGPVAQELKKLFGVVKTSLAKRDFEQAAEALGSIEELLDQPTKPPATGLDGMDMGQVQAGPVKDGYDILKEEKSGNGIINYQRETTVIIENNSSKVLRLVKKEYKDPKRAQWATEPEEEIPAGKKITIVVKTKGWRGGAKGNTSGGVIYKVVGEAKETKVYLEWTRTAGGKRDTRHNAEGGYHTDGQQSKLEEFTFKLTELAPATKPKDPQSPADANPKDPQTDGGKDSKSPPPADIHVLFDLDKSDLTPMAQSALRRFANAYKAAKSTAEITVEGWASIEGPELRNERLSYNRAKAVSDYLSKEEELPKGNIQWEGKRTTTAFGKDEKDLPPNRRATISLSGAKGPPATPPDTEAKEPQSPADPKTKVKQTRDNEEPPKRPVHPHSASRTGA